MSAVFFYDRWDCQILHYKALISEKAHMAEEKLVPEIPDVHCIPACLFS
jgi:hypothetical protein